MGGVCPTTLIGRRNDALMAWMGRGITGDVEGHGGRNHENGAPKHKNAGPKHENAGPKHENAGPWAPIQGGRALWIARLGAYGPKGTMNWRHTATKVVRLVSIRPRRL